MQRLNQVPATRYEFFTALAESELLSVYQFAKADGIVPESVESARESAQLLVGAKMLTPFQSERLLAGRSDGFLLGQHVIQEQVGKGSVGRVYRATHRTMNRTVAIKVMSADVTRTGTARQNFQREVRAAAKLNHPNIITAYDANEVGDRFYLVLEFVDGPTLDALVRQRGPLPWPEACELVRQVALGLQHAHEHGMVHRDIKPANLLVARTSAGGCVVKIADFGIAKFTPPTRTSSPGANLTGTPDYISPEQAHHPHLVDHRADLYSLGCVLYFLLAGRPPFPDGTTEEKVRRHVHEMPAPILQLRPDVPPPVAELLARLLAKNPNHRPPTAAEVAARLDALVAGFDSGRIEFDLPAVFGQHSVASGLTGASAAETSPWSQLTDEMVAAVDTSSALENTPFTPPMTRRRRQAPRRGLPAGIVLALCASIATACLLGLGLLIKLAGK